MLSISAKNASKMSKKSAPLNGVTVMHISNDDVYDFTIAVTVGRDEVVDIAVRPRGCSRVVTSARFGPRPACAV